MLRRIGGDDADKALSTRIRDLVAPLRERLGEPVDGEPELTGTLRGLALRTLAVAAHDQDAINDCRSLLDAADRGDTVDPELLAAATTAVAATGGIDDYERLLAGYRNGSTPQEQLRHLYALAEFDDADLIRRTCELAMSGEVKTQNAPFLLRSCIANVRHGALAWEFVAQQWSTANDRFPTNTIVRMVDSVKLLIEDNEVRSVQSFFAEHPIPQAEATLRQILERQQVNARCAREQRAVLTALAT